ncbi:DUF2279 domain-containing protein [Sphingobacteriaceae bacterium]|nr:DUF2279 domain-containing protein [Sphingobacteriaceae bacterium]
MLIFTGMRPRLSLFIFLVFLTQVFLGQNDSLKADPFKKRKVVLASSTGALTVGSLFYLNVAWYSGYNTGKFHFFNDNKEWLQMDKVGHTFTTYQMSRLMMNAFDWAGYTRKQKLIYGGGIGFVYMTTIEVMDGFSRGWGFSWGDQLADGLGTGMAIAQELAWREQRFQLKLSYSESGLAKYNPALLGETPYTQVLKDYNGQTYWLSINPSAFIKRENKFPKWLNIALGYGAYGMLGGHYNNSVVVDNEGNVLKFDRERRFYLSLDVDLTRIKTKSKILKGIFSVVNMLKFPAPALQCTKNGFRFYPIYY